MTFARESSARWTRLKQALASNTLPVAVAVWVAAFLAWAARLLAGRVVSVPYHVYIAAAHRWLARQPLYETQTIDGFQYFPHSAMLFAPFALLGSPAGDIVWRAISWSSYAWGVWRGARLLAPTRVSQGFLIASCLALGPALGGLENGQANVMLAACTLHVAADLSGRRWWRATLLLGFGLALKPLMIVMVLLVWALYRPMLWRLPIAVIALALAPLLFQDPAYVMEQYAGCANKLALTSRPGRLFEDLRGLLASLGWLMQHPVYLFVRCVAALGVLWLCWLAQRRVLEPRRSLLIGALAVGYLMLFNPRTLGSSYAMPAAMAGVFAAGCLFERRWPHALALTLMSLAWTVNRHWPGLGFIQHWLRPGAAIGFVALLTREALAPGGLGRDDRYPHRHVDGEERGETLPPLAPRLSTSPPAPRRRTCR